MINAVAERGEQVVGLLLSTMPLAERMLLYNLAMVAMVMLPGKALPVHEKQMSSIC